MRPGERAQLEIRVAAYRQPAVLRDPTIRRTPIAGPDPRVARFVVEEVPSSTPMITSRSRGEPHRGLRRLEARSNAGLTGGPCSSRPADRFDVGRPAALQRRRGFETQGALQGRARGRTVETQIPGEIARSWSSWRGSPPRGPAPRSGWDIRRSSACSTRTDAPARARRDVHDRGGQAPGRSTPLRHRCSTTARKTRSVRKISRSRSSGLCSRPRRPAPGTVADRCPGR